MISRGIIKNQPAKEFAMVWDDCKASIAKAFDDTIAPQLRAMFKERDVCATRFFIRGWTGQNEAMHSTCVFTTLCLDSRRPDCQHGMNFLTSKDMSLINCLGPPETLAAPAPTADRVWTLRKGNSCQGYAKEDETERTLEASKVACATNVECLSIVCPSGYTMDCTLRSRNFSIQYKPEDCYIWHEPTYTLPTRAQPSGPLGSCTVVAGKNAVHGLWKGINAQLHRARGGRDVAGNYFSAKKPLDCRHLCSSSPDCFVFTHHIGNGGLCALWTRGEAIENARSEEHQWIDHQGATSGSCIPAR